MEKDLFSQAIDSPANLLPKDGEVFLHGRVFDLDESAKILAALDENVAWKHDEAVIFGKKIATKRKVAWYADRPFSYTYSKVTRTALPWFPLLLRLKANVERICNDRFNSCLLNRYADGNEGMAWHSDAEKDLARHGTIASLSFGAERKFAFKHKSTKETVSVFLQNGSLLTMKGRTQDFWLHSIPKSKRILTPRISLTFRQIITAEVAQRQK